MRHYNGVRVNKHKVCFAEDNKAGFCRALMIFYPRWVRENLAIKRVHTFMTVHKISFWFGPTLKVGAHGLVDLDWKQTSDCSVAQQIPAVSLQWKKHELLPFILYHVIVNALFESYFLNGRTQNKVNQCQIDAFLLLIDQGTIHAKESHKIHQKPHGIIKIGRPINVYNKTQEGKKIHGQNQVQFTLSQGTNKYKDQKQTKTAYRQSGTYHVNGLHHLIVAPFFAIMKI